ncbi:MAG: DJ-1 family glyoxalase III [Candidatus Omnitrophota bacterium]
MSKKVLVILADGFEEVEAIAPIDILRRAGLEVVVAGLSGREQISARGLRVTCDALLSDVRDQTASFDACILPGGGKGAENLAASRVVGDVVVSMHKAGKLIAAICASPAVVLAPLGILEGRKATCYPGTQKFLGAGVEYREENVVKDGNILTSRGPGTALVFGLAVLESLCGPASRDKIARDMLVAGE